MDACSFEVANYVESDPAVVVSKCLLLLGGQIEPGDAAGHDCGEHV